MSMFQLRRKAIFLYLPNALRMEIGFRTIYHEPLPPRCECNEKACSTKNVLPDIQNNDSKWNAIFLNRRGRPVIKSRHQFTRHRLDQLSRQKFWGEYSRPEIDLRLLVGHASVVDHLKQCERLIYKDPDRNKFKGLHSQFQNCRVCHLADDGEVSDSSDSSDMSDYEDILNEVGVSASSTERFSLPLAKFHSFGNENVHSR